MAGIGRGLLGPRARVGVAAGGTATLATATAAVLLLTGQFGSAPPASAPLPRADGAGPATSSGTPSAPASQGSGPSGSAPPSGAQAAVGASSAARPATQATGAGSSGAGSSGAGSSGSQPPGATSPPATTAGALSGAPSTPGRTSPTPSAGSSVDLLHWALTIPVRNRQGEATTVPSARVISPYLQIAPDGSLVFWCPVTGARTANADYARTELRERLVPSDESKNWTVARGGTLTARLAVTSVPRNNPEIVVGQIHGYAGGGPLVLVRWENRSIIASVRNSPSASSGPRYVLATGVGVGQPFSYLVKVSGGVLTLQANGRPAVRVGIDHRWSGQPLYFKAGAYLQAHGNTVADGGRVRFWALAATH